MRRESRFINESNLFASLRGNDATDGAVVAVEDGDENPEQGLLCVRPRVRGARRRREICSGGIV